MLYYKFRETCSRIQNSLKEIENLSSPDIDEDSPIEIEDSFSVLRSAITMFNNILASLPIELVGHPDKRFGPNVNVGDIRVALSSLKPIVSLLNEECPFVSYFPVDLYRESVLLISDYMCLSYGYFCYVYDPRGGDGDMECLINGVDSPVLSIEGEANFVKGVKGISALSDIMIRDVENEFKTPIGEL